MHLDDDILQRYFDGELSPAEERRVRALVESNPAAQRRLSELARIGEMLRAAFADAANRVDADAMFAGIERGIAREPALPTGRRLRLIAGEWMEHRKGVVIPLIATTAVAAAALLTFLLPENAAQTGGQLASSPVSTAPQVAVHGSQIENVDFGESTGTVFEIDNQGVSAAVVWIADDADEETEQGEVSP